MKTTKNNFNKRQRLKTAAKVVTLAAAATLSSQAAAFQLDFDNREMTGYVDTTVSLSTAMALTNANGRNTSSASGRQQIFDNSGDIYSAPFSV